jgi:cytochrome b subunit of formate dehydrogenase
MAELEHESTPVADAAPDGAAPAAGAATRAVDAPSPGPQKRYYQRFDGYSRFLHLLVILSFLSLAVTGMTIKFSGVGIFQTLSRLLGGYQVTGFVHRTAAIVTFVYFFLHLYYVIRRMRRAKMRPIEILRGPNTLMFQKEDLVDFGKTIKWFLGLGPRPDYGRWTYWEKFDYFAVFWGVAVIGLSGLILWFPEWFTGMGLPGWLVNVATIIHSDEALLATGFIFTVHFFNGHFRPDKFPMDPVIFTGRVEVEELKIDRPRLYRKLVESGELERGLVDAPNPLLEKWARIFGLTALTIGLATVVMIIYSMIFLYR